VSSNKEYLVQTTEAAIQGQIVAAINNSNSKNNNDDDDELKETKMNH